MMHCPINIRYTEFFVPLDLTWSNSADLVKISINNIKLELFNVYPTPIFTKRHLTYPKKSVFLENPTTGSNKGKSQPQFKYIYTACPQNSSGISSQRDYFKKKKFPDEVTLHVSDAVHRRGVRSWGTENPHIVKKHIRDCPKLEVCFVVDAVHATKGVLRNGMKILRVSL